MNFSQLFFVPTLGGQLLRRLHWPPACLPGDRNYLVEAKLRESGGGGEGRGEVYVLGWEGRGRKSGGEPDF